MLSIVFILYTIAEIYFLIRAFKKDKSVLLELIGSYVLVTAFLIFKRMTDYDILNYSIILVILTVCGHVFIGDCLNYYNKSIRFDRYLHAFGSFSFAIFSYLIILSIVNPAVNTRMLSAIFVFTLGLSLGLIFEIIEFTLDRTRNKSPKAQKSQKGLADTDFDMIFDIIGSFIAAVFSYFILK